MTDQGRSFDTVRIDALVCGPGFQERMAEPRVIEIAERIASGRDVATPIVRASDMNVIAGEDVLAAYCLLDGVELEVELVHDGSFDDELPTELSPDGETRYGLGVAAAEAERTELTPAPTRDGGEEAIRRIAGRVLDGVPSFRAMREAERTELTPVPPELEQFDRACEVLSQSPGGLAALALAPAGNAQQATLERVQAAQAQGVTQKAAVAAVAAETGKSEHAVKKAANRAKRARDKVSIETWGREQPEAWMASTAELRRTMTNASNAIRTAMSALSPLVGSATVPGANFVATHGELKDHARRIRELRPACVCAWCKNEPALVVRCVACGGRGWLGEKAMSLVPKELFPAGSAMAQGRPVELAAAAPVADWRDSELPQWELPPDANPMCLVPIRVTDEDTGESTDSHALMPLQSLRVHAVRYSEADSVPLESRSHTLEPVTKEHAEQAWNALEEANGGEAFLDEAVFVDVPDDGDVW